MNAPQLFLPPLPRDVDDAMAATLPLPERLYHLARLHNVELRDMRASVVMAGTGTSHGTLTAPKRFGAFIVTGYDCGADVGELSIHTEAAQHVAGPVYALLNRETLGAPIIVNEGQTAHFALSDFVGVATTITRISVKGHIVPQWFADIVRGAIGEHWQSSIFSSGETAFSRSVRMGRRAIIDGCYRIQLATLGSATALYRLDVKLGPLRLTPQGISFGSLSGNVGLDPAENAFQLGATTSNPALTRLWAAVQVGDELSVDYAGPATPAAGLIVLFMGRQFPK